LNVRVLLQDADRAPCCIVIEPSEVARPVTWQSSAGRSDRPQDLGEPGLTPFWL